MAKSSDDDERLRKLLSICFTKSPGIWSKSRRLSAHTAKPRVLVLTTRKVSTIAKFYYQANESSEQACVHVLSVRSYTEHLKNYFNLPKKLRF